MSISKGLKKIAFNVAYGYLDKDPESNIPRLMDWVDRMDSKDAVKGQREAVRSIIGNKDGNWYKLLLSMWSDIDSGVRKKLFENYIFNTTVLSAPIREAASKEYDCSIPWSILLDPTSACNLHCIGCWAANYSNKLGMDFDTLDSIICQGKEIGIYMYIYSGGEPLVRKKDIIALCNKHQDCEFLAFTNGTLIDETFADDMLRVRNFVPAISIEGFETATDARRGEGVFAKVHTAMDILRKKKLLFGVSCCYTSQNVYEIGSEEYFDKMIEWGAKFAWFFTYMPVGVDAVPELMATAEQREFMYHQVRDFRNTKSLFTMDFWNDGEFVNGCIAGGRIYLHINAAGDVEPCAFIHYADSNIYRNTLVEALRAPLFRQYRKNQPFNENMLRPCPLLDNPGKLAVMVDKSGAKSTDMQSPEDVHTLSEKCLDKAEKWSTVADKLWECPDHWKSGRKGT